MGREVLHMKYDRAIIYILAGLLAVFAGCEPAAEEPAAEQEEVKPPEPIDGQTAFFRMFPAARQWSPDAEGLRLESLSIEEVPSDSGKFGAWRAGFYSASKGRVAIFNYSVVEVGGKLQKGVFQDHEESYAGGRAKPWPVAALKSSSEAAYTTAMEQKETKEYVAENPDIPIMILLENTDRHPNPAWRVIWGTSISTSGYSVFVDVSTGGFLEVMH